MSSHVTLLPLSARLPRQQVKQRNRAGVPPRAWLAWDARISGCPTLPTRFPGGSGPPTVPQWWGSSTEIYEWSVLRGSPGPPNGDWYPKWLPRSIGAPTPLSFQSGSGGRPGRQKVQLPHNGTGGLSSPAPSPPSAPAWEAPAGLRAVATWPPLPPPLPPVLSGSLAGSGGARNGHQEPGRGGREWETGRRVGGRGRLGGGVSARQAYLPAGS